MDRNDAIKFFRNGLKKLTGKAWSVTGDRGTAWGWINIDVPPSQRTWQHVDTGRKDDMGRTVYDYVDKPGGEFGYMPQPACEELAKVFDESRPVHHQGLSISPDSREYYVRVLQGKLA